MKRLPGSEKQNDFVSVYDTLSKIKILIQFLKREIFIDSLATLKKFH